VANLGRQFAQSFGVKNGKKHTRRHTNKARKTLFGFGELCFGVSGKLRRAFGSLKVGKFASFCTKAWRSFAHNFRFEWNLPSSRSLGEAWPEKLGQVDICIQANRFVSIRVETLGANFKEQANNKLAARSEANWRVASPTGRP